MNVDRKLNAAIAGRDTGRRLMAIGLGILIGATSAMPAHADVDIAKVPLFTTSNVPGNLLLVPSVEFPTINSVASLGNYDPGKRYLGYFSSDKCYDYVYHATDELQRHFTPAAIAVNHTCSSKWSGNFLNWATTQTIDPFRLVLTGGLRVRDTPIETWVEKARHDGQGGESYFPNRQISAALAAGATPFSGNVMQIRIWGLGSQMRFRLGNSSVDTNPTAYNPGGTVGTSRGYDLSVRVKVCDPNATHGGVEPHCRPYSQGWKPEGVLQQYWRNLRYGVFGYLTDNGATRDGGVLRSRMKTIGPTIPGGVVEPNNTNKEWDPVTGVLIRNPNTADATATSTAHGISILDSGVINYINKFGQLTTQNNKNFDPVSELYYTALRYLKNQGNVPEYSNMSGTATARYNLADGFPVITNWDDPVQNWCQPNVILGIGDIYTHKDKNLPGSSFTSQEPSKPAAVSADTTINVITRTNQVAAMEGITINHNPFTGRENSAFMAGLAWDAHTRDIRPDLSGGKTTVSTYWVDVLEEQSLEGMARNQFALAAKYGGFRVPENFNPDTHTGALPTAWWHSNGETLTPFGPRGNGQASFSRPDNFFTAGSADKMAESLTKAFESIIREVETSATAAATSSAILQTDTLLFVAGFRSNDWSGMLVANDIDDETGELLSVVWDAEAGLRGRTPSSRNIYTLSRDSGDGVPLVWASLDTDQRNALNRRADDAANDGLGSARIDWLRGDDSANASFRNRSGGGSLRLLGDVINSNPQFAGKQDFGYGILGSLGASYTAFRTTYQNRPNVIYVGANDGMMHGFDAQTGNELLAYMPSELLLPESGSSAARINQLMSPGYSHRYFMDGTVAVGDAHAASWANGDSGWKTVLVGTMGAGGRTVFALDVTAPQSFGAGKVLWEFTDPDLGYGVGQPTIARMRNGEWAAIFGNGYNSNNHRSALFIVRLSDGALLAKIDTGAGALATPNGMAAPKATDWPGLDMEARYVYAGDLLGNVWRFDVSSSTPSTWADASSRSLLFQARDSEGVVQSITARPELAIKPNFPGSLMILVGTGSYFRVLDGGNMQVQSLYGLIDDRFSVPGYSIAGRNELLQQTIVEEGFQTFENADGGSETHLVRVVSDNDLENTHKGWYLDLVYAGNTTGERVISSPTFPSGQTQERIRFTTLIPDEDACGPNRTGFIMDIQIASGGRPDQSVLDLNADGRFDDQDKTSSGNVVSGLGAGRGEQMTIIRDRDSSLDHMYGGDDLLADGLNAAGPANRQSWRQLR